MLPVRLSFSFPMDLTLAVGGGDEFHGKEEHPANRTIAEPPARRTATAQSVFMGLFIES